MCHYRSHKHTHTHAHIHSQVSTCTHIHANIHTLVLKVDLTTLLYVCMWAPEIESQLFSLYTHTYTQYTTEGPNLTGHVRLIHHVCRWTILWVMGQNIDVFLWISQLNFRPSYNTWPSWQPHNHYPTADLCSSTLNSKRLGVVSLSAAFIRTILRS